MHNLLQPLILQVRDLLRGHHDQCADVLGVPKDMPHVENTDQLKEWLRTFIKAHIVDKGQIVCFVANLVWEVFS